MEEMEDNNLILKAYRGLDNSQTINVDLKSHVYGYELYRIVLMLINQILKMGNKDNKKLDEDTIQKFINELVKDYIDLYKSEE